MGKGMNKGSDKVEKSEEKHSVKSEGIPYDEIFLLMAEKQKLEEAVKLESGTNKPYNEWSNYKKKESSKEKLQLVEKNLDKLIRENAKKWQETLSTNVSTAITRFEDILMNKRPEWNKTFEKYVMTSTSSDGKQSLGYHLDKSIKSTGNPSKPELMMQNIQEELIKSRRDVELITQLENLNTCEKLAKNQMENIFSIYLNKLYVTQREENVKLVQETKTQGVELQSLKDEISKLKEKVIDLEKDTNADQKELDKNEIFMKNQKAEISCLKDKIKEMTPIYEGNFALKMLPKLYESLQTTFETYKEKNDAERQTLKNEKYKKESETKELLRDKDHKIEGLQYDLKNVNKEKHDLENTISHKNSEIVHLEKELKQTKQKFEHSSNQCDHFKKQMENLEELNKENLSKIDSLNKELQFKTDKTLKETPSSNPIYVSYGKKHNDVFDMVYEIIDRAVMKMTGMMKSKSSTVIGLDSKELDKRIDEKAILIEDAIIPYLTSELPHHLGIHGLESTHLNVDKLAKKLETSFYDFLYTKFDIVMINGELFSELKECVEFSITIHFSDPPISWISSTRAKYDTTKHEPTDFKIDIRRITFPGLEVKDLVIAKARVQVSCK